MGITGIPKYEVWEYYERRLARLVCEEGICCCCQKRDSCAKEAWLEEFTAHLTDPAEVIFFPGYEVTGWVETLKLRLPQPTRKKEEELPLE